MPRAFTVSKGRKEKGEGIGYHQPPPRRTLRPLQKSRRQVLGGSWPQFTVEGGEVDEGVCTGLLCLPWSLSALSPYPSFRVHNFLSFRTPPAPQPTAHPSGLGMRFVLP